MKSEASKIEVRVTSLGKPVPGAKVSLLFLDKENLPHSEVSVTDKDGKSFAFYNPNKHIYDAAIVNPSGKYWSSFSDSKENQISIECPPLLENDSRWWHQLVGFRETQYKPGQGIKIGIIDSGIGPGNRLKNIIDLGSIIDNIHDPEGGKDIDGHGTGVCGIIGAIPDKNDSIIGIAYNADIYSIRVFKKDNGIPNPNDIASAIAMLTEKYKVDLINISQASPTAFENIHSAIKKSKQNGVLTISSAGNLRGKVSYPAAFPEVIAVSAIGKDNVLPDGTVAKAMISKTKEHTATNGLYFSAFSNFGKEIFCSAPGVGLMTVTPEISENQSQSMYIIDQSGTSLASAVTTGVLASLLSKNRIYNNLERNEKRADYARSILKKSCMDIGLKEQFQGYGLPQISSLTD